MDHCATSDVLWYYGSPHMDTHQVSWGKQQGIKFTDVYHMTRFLAVLWILWFNIAHTYIHRERNKDTQQAKGPKGWHTHIYIYIYIMTTFYVLTVAICVTLKKWFPDINNLHYRLSRCLCFSKITDLYKSHTCWLDSIRLSSSHETQRILIKVV